MCPPQVPSNSSSYMCFKASAFSGVKEARSVTAIALPVVGAWLSGLGSCFQRSRSRRFRSSLPSWSRNSTRDVGSGWYGGGSDRRRGMSGLSCAPETLASGQVDQL